MAGSDSDKVRSYALAGGLGGAMLLLSLVVIGVKMYMKKKQRKRAEEQANQQHLAAAGLPLPVTAEKKVPMQPSYEPPPLLYGQSSVGYAPSVTAPLPFYDGVLSLQAEAPHEEAAIAARWSVAPSVTASMSASMSMASCSPPMSPMLVPQPLNRQSLFAAPSPMARLAGSNPLLAPVPGDERILEAQERQEMRAVTQTHTGGQGQALTFALRGGGNGSTNNNTLTPSLPLAEPMNSAASVQSVLPEPMSKK